MMLDDYPQSLRKLIPLIRRDCRFEKVDAEMSFLSYSGNQNLHILLVVYCPFLILLD